MRQMLTHVNMPRQETKQTSGEYFRDLPSWTVINRAEQIQKPCWYFFNSHQNKAKTTRQFHVLTCNHFKLLFLGLQATPISPTILGCQLSAPMHLSMHHQKSASVCPRHANTGTPASANAAATSFCVETTLQAQHRISAPRSISVSISTYFTTKTVEKLPSEWKKTKDTQCSSLPHTAPQDVYKQRSLHLAGVSHCVFFCEGQTNQEFPDWPNRFPGGQKQPVWCFLCKSQWSRQN